MKRKHKASAAVKRVETGVPQSTSVQAGSVPITQKGHRWCLLLLILALIAPFAAILLAPGGRVLGNPRCDNPAAYYFYSYFLGKCWREGILPLWNPHIMLGIPFLGDGQASVFHPLSILFFFLRTGVAINWLIAISFVLTGLFFYGYLKALGLGPEAAWCGSIAWSFSNAMISRIYAGHLNILLTIISIPLIMMLWERYRAGGGLRYLVGISFAYALMILAYYPQLLYIFSLFFLIFVLIQSALTIMADHGAVWREGKSILKLGTFIILGIGVGAIQLFPGLDFVSRSFRQTASIDFCGSFSLPPENLLTLIAPGFFGSTIVNDVHRYWGRNVFWEMWIYLGILPLIMAIVGAWSAPRMRSLALLSCSVIFLVLGLGKNTPFFSFAYNYIPSFDIFRGSSKNTLITLFCLVTLSAHGFDRFFRETDDCKRVSLLRTAVITGGGLLLTVIGLRLFLVGSAQGTAIQWMEFLKGVIRSREVLADLDFLTNPAFFSISARGAAQALTRTLILIVVSMVIIYILRTARWRAYLFPAFATIILFDLMTVFFPLMRTFDESLTKYPKDFELANEFSYRPRILVPSSMPNMAMRYGYSSVFGYTGNTLKRYNDFISRVQGLDPEVPHSLSLFEKLTPFYKLLSLDAVALDKKEVPQGATAIGRLGDHVLIPYEGVQEKIPRVYLAAAPRYFSRREDALQYVFSEKADVVAQPAIERTMNAIPAHPLISDETVRFVSFEPNRVELETRTNHPRELVLCSMFERNWKAQVNGVPVRVEPANYIYRAVQVPAGVSRVVFEYRPAAFYWGITVTVISIAILILVGLATSMLDFWRGGNFPEHTPLEWDWLRRRFNPNQPPQHCNV